MFVLRAMTIEGVSTGTLAEAEELMVLARTGHARLLFHSPSARSASPSRARRFCAPSCGRRAC